MMSMLSFPLTSLWFLPLGFFEILAIGGHAYAQAVHTMSGSTAVIQSEGYVFVDLPGRMLLNGLTKLGFPINDTVVSYSLPLSFLLAFAVNAVIIAIWFRLRYPTQDATQD